MKDLRTIVGEITLRYALTYESIFKYNDNYYGQAIISNARIMSKDKLNRFLIDDNSIFWFNKTINGIENLQVLTLEDFLKINLINKLPGNDTEMFNSIIFPIKNYDKNRILTVDLMRIGEISSKEDIISIYNLHIQTFLEAKLIDNIKGINKFTVSLGNLNVSGISEKNEKSAHN